MAIEAVERAKAALAQGDLAGAWGHAEAALTATPEDIDALYVGAVILRFQKDLDAARGLIDRLLAVQPDLGRAHQERGHLLRAAGERQACIAAYARAVECNPVLAASWKILAALSEGADEEMAQKARANLRDIAQQPGELMAAMAAYYDQEYQLAESRVRAFLLKAPDHPVAMRLLADLGTRMGEYEDAEFILEQCKAFNPDFLPARFDYVDVLTKRFHFEAALREAEELLARDPANPQFRTLYANQLLQVGQTEAALEQYDVLHEAEPDLAHISLSRGHALKTLGRVEAAVGAYRDAYGARGDFGDAYWSLANLKTFRFPADELAAMLRAEADPATDTDDRIHLCFAAGKAFEDAGDYAQSFAFYARGNALRQGILGYRPGAVTAEVDAQIRACTPALFAANAGAGCPAPDPIFILGLPRAGSTLLEQILASHSQVEGTMELPDIMAIAARLNGRLAASEAERYPANLAELPRDKFTELGEGYMTSVAIHRREGLPRFIDKMPNNFRHIGLIHLLLPNARIIDARRDPMACGFSLFKQLFAQGQDFSYDLNHIGRYYRDYLRLMDHWDKVLPGKVLRVVHEDVIEDLEGQVRRMLDFCGLPFEQGCIEFHRSTRAVRTPSSEQVRRPINRDGTQVWRNFEPWLAPLKAALEG